MIKNKIRRIKKYQSFRKGSILALAVIGLIILAILGLGILNVAFGVRRQAIVLKNETSAMLAAEAGYERAVFWMEQQPDVISSLALAGGTATGSNTFTSSNSSYDYAITRNIIPAGARVVYRIESNGHCGTSNRTVRVLVMQAVTGWDMGMCRIPNGTSSTAPVSFATGEEIYMPIHINKYNDSPDVADIYISGTPQFYDEVQMGESKGNKYPSSIMNLFKGGISFDQPDSKITNESVITAKINRFSAMVNPLYKYTPTLPSWSNQVTNPMPAVQLEFFVGNDGAGYVRITNNCVVRGYSPGTRDWKIRPGTSGTRYQQYNIYGWHYVPVPTIPPLPPSRITVKLSDTYVTPSYGGPSFGLIYVSTGAVNNGGNVIIGSALDSTEPIAVANPAQLNVIQGNIVIVAEGNIWITNSLKVDGAHMPATPAPGNMPASDNPNMLSMLSGIVTQDTVPPTTVRQESVIKVIDTGRTDPSYGGTSITPALKVIKVSGTTVANYEPVGIKDSGQSNGSSLRHLPDPMVVEAGITVGGGGWGAEYVGNRKETSGSQDDLIVRGTITERVRGVVGVVGTDGFLKNYYFDERLLEGFIPEDMRWKGKYIPVPAGWEDYRP